MVESGLAAHPIKIHLCFFVYYTDMLVFYYKVSLVLVKLMRFKKFLPSYKPKWFLMF